MLSKKCEGCATILTQRAKECPAHFDRRRFCSISCKARRRNALGTPEQRLWRKVKKGTPEECWIWTGAKQQRGYGLIHVEGLPYFTHRLSLEIKLERQISEGMLCCHTCDNPSCVNPAHLYEGTPKDNMQDAIMRNRHRWRK